MSHTTEQIGLPSVEEQRLLDLQAGNYDLVASDMVAALHDHISPSVLSIARPDLLYGLVQSTHKILAEQPAAPSPEDDPRTHDFNALLPAAEAGDPAAICALPKLAHSVGELATAITLTLDNFINVAAWREGRPYIQFIGSFNPQHIGHRSTMKDTLALAGANSSGIVQIVQNHPIKKDSLPPYEERFADSERKLYSSTLISPVEVTLLDLPLGLGLAKKGIAQIDLLADITGDDKRRWLVGSDKFMTDVTNVQADKELNKAGARFRDVHLYVAQRDTQTIAEIEIGADYVRDRFGAEITIVPPANDQLVLGASASKIRALRSQQRHQEADDIEYGDLPRLRPVRH